MYWPGMPQVSGVNISAFPNCFEEKRQCETARDLPDVPYQTIVNSRTARSIPTDLAKELLPAFR
jgi:hypothetical protein